MPILKNNAAGPRIFNVKGGAPGQVIQRTLMPGEAAELDLLVDPDKDPSLKAMLDSKEVEMAGKEALKAPEPMDMAKVMELQAKADEAMAEAAAAREQVRALELDTARRTIPRQFGSDGGPAQSPTVDGRGGALTAAQEEKGRVEPPMVATAVPLPPAQKPAEAPKPAAKK